MQTHGGVPADAAITAPERNFSHRLLVDWNRDGKFDHPYSDLSSIVEEAEINRALEGALPQHATLIDGYSAAELNVTLGGSSTPEGPSAAWLFSPFASSSPLYTVTRRGAPIKYSIIVSTVIGNVEYPQFTGWAREFNITSGDRKVKLKCLDFAEPLRAPITLLRWAHTQDPSEHDLMNSQWIIDHILRRNGYYQSPPIVPECIFSHTMHGATLTEVGIASPTSTYTGAWNWVQGKYGLAVDARGDNTRSVNARGYEDLRPVQNGMTYGAGLIVRTQSPNPGETYIEIGYGAWNSIRLNVSADNVVTARFARMPSSGNPQEWSVTGPTLPQGDHWVYVGMEATITASNTQVRFNLNGVVTEASGQRWSPLQTSFPGVTAYPRRQSQCLQAWQSTTRTNNWSWTPDFEPTATLSRGLNLLSHLPNIVEENSWDVLKELIHAEFGVLYADELGHVYFLNREDMRSTGDFTNRELGPDIMQDIALADTSDDITNTIVVKSTLGMCAPRMTVWEASSADQLTYQPGNTTVLVTDLEDCWYADLTPTYFQESAWKDESPTSGFLPVHANNGSIAPNVSMSLNAIDERSFEYTVHNGNAFAIRLASKPATDPNDQGSPRLRVGGVGIRYWDTKTNSVSNQPSINRHGRRTWELPETRWSQSYSGQAWIANSLLEDLADPLPVLDEITIAGDPRLQLTDVLKLRDPEGLGDTMHGQIIAITRSLSREGLQDALSLRLLEAPGNGLWDDPAYGRWDQTLIWGD